MNRFVNKMKRKKEKKKLKKQESVDKGIAAEKAGLPKPPKGTPFDSGHILDTAEKVEQTKKLREKMGKRVSARKSIIGDFGKKKVDLGKFLEDQNERRKEKGLIPPEGKMDLKRFTTRTRKLRQTDFKNPFYGKLGSKKKKAGKRRRTRKKRKRRRTKKKRRRRKKKRRRTRK